MPVGFTKLCLPPTTPKPKLAPLGCETDPKGALGPPVNCCTMARKFAVSVLSRVVGVRREARERLRAGLETRPSGLRWFAVGLEFPEPSGVAVLVVVTTVASETRSFPPPNMGPEEERW